MFTERAIELVRETGGIAGADPDAAATLFYGKPFAKAPGVRPLLPDEMKAQGQKLMQMIGVAVNDMDEAEQTVPALEALGKRHVDDGALARSLSRRRRGAARTAGDGPRRRQRVSKDDPAMGG